ncbi:hypothetical protein SAMN05444169_8328 [Bradyrhizobium erythrophlei]|uniref:Uncharacterized protein n=1 Tax=Bradyrhizobium erythrophlei TaxID=1437360 RepID=A0A1M5UE02_9BRAD|nr:hypothetical protein SAMN05444169_8328 [Bradyrhizobium erythrophlei]
MLYESNPQNPAHRVPSRHMVNGRLKYPWKRSVFPKIVAIGQPAPALSHSSVSRVTVIDASVLVRLHSKFSRR